MALRMVQNYTTGSMTNRSPSFIRKHINNVFEEKELVKENNTQKMRVVGVKQLVPFYNLDVIISVKERDI